MIFLNFSDNSKIVINESLHKNFIETCDWPERSGFSYIPDSINNNTIKVLNDLMEFYATDNSAYGGINYYNFDWNNYKPKIVIDKCQYFLYYLYLSQIAYKANEKIEDVLASNKLYSKYLKQANVSFKYNLLKDGELYYDKYKVGFMKYALDYFKTDDTIVEKFGCSNADIANLVEIDNYWIDYCENRDLLMEPPVPYVKDVDCEFLGWYKDKECTEKWDFNNDIVHFENENDELVLYAKWK